MLFLHFSSYNLRTHSKNLVSFVNDVIRWLKGLRHLISKPVCINKTSKHVEVIFIMTRFLSFSILIQINQSTAYFICNWKNLEALLHLILLLKPIFVYRFKYAFFINNSVGIVLFANQNVLWIEVGEIFVIMSTFPKQKCFF